MTQTAPDPQPPRGVTTEIPIRWGDMDALGHVNNAVYLRYCESARIAYFEALGLERELIIGPDQGILLVAASLNFRRPLVYPGTVVVRVSTTATSARSITMGYTLESAADGALAADGKSVVVWADYRAGRALPLPEPLVEAIVRLEGDAELRPR